MKTIKMIVDPERCWKEEICTLHFRNRCNCYGQLDMGKVKTTCGAYESKADRYFRSVEERDLE